MDRCSALTLVKSELHKKVKYYSFQQLLPRAILQCDSNIFVSIIQLEMIA